ncbi:6501_t:CDS:2, partial [Gigaspora margarita]
NFFVSQRLVHLNVSAIASWSDTCSTIIQAYDNMLQSYKQKSKAPETALKREESSSSLLLEYASDTNISNEIL